jgi:hypothetical protein
MEAVNGCSKELHEVPELDDIKIFLPPGKYVSKCLQCGEITPFEVTE